METLLIYCLNVLPGHTPSPAEPHTPARDWELGIKVTSTKGKEAGLPHISKALSQIGVLSC